MYDLKKDFIVKDLSETKLTFDLKDVDINVPGEYEAKVEVKDVYGNRSIKSFKEVVV